MVIVMLRQTNLHVVAKNVGFFEIDINELWCHFSSQSNFYVAFLCVKRKVGEVHWTSESVGEFFPEGHHLVVLVIYGGALDRRLLLPNGKA